MKAATLRKLEDRGLGCRVAQQARLRFPEGLILRELNFNPEGGRNILVGSRPHYQPLTCMWLKLVSFGRSTLLPLLCLRICRLHTQLLLFLAQHLECIQEDTRIGHTVTQN